MARKPIQLPISIFNKLSRMGFAGQSLGDLIEDLCDFAKEHQEDFDAFLDDRYEGDEE